MIGQQRFIGSNNALPFAKYLVPKTRQDLLPAITSTITSTSGKSIKDSGVSTQVTFDKSMPRSLVYFWRTLPSQQCACRCVAQSTWHFVQNFKCSCANIPQPARPTRKILTRGDFYCRTSLSIFLHLFLYFTIHRRFPKE